MKPLRGQWVWVQITPTGHIMLNPVADTKRMLIYEWDERVRKGECVGTYAERVGRGWRFERVRIGPGEKQRN